MIVHSSYYFVLPHADIYHAYKLVREGGIDEEQIIVFHFNDIAKHRYNPSPGTVRHVEGGEDLYPGVPWVR